MAQEALVVRGYQPLLRALRNADRDTKREVRAALRDVGEVVRVEAVKLLDPVAPLSAAGYRVRVRQRGVAVEQSLRKTTGLHPEWGDYQMRRVLLPARHNTFPEVEELFEKAVDFVAAKFNE